MTVNAGVDDHHGQSHFVESLTHDVDKSIAVSHVQFVGCAASDNEHFDVRRLFVLAAKSVFVSRVPYRRFAGNVI